MQIIKDLQSRGLIQDISSPDLDEKLQEGDSFYIGYDPTAPSLHLGNFLAIMTMLRLAKAGLKSIMLFGGATGQVGDPSGKSDERPVLSLDQVAANVASQEKQAKAIFDRLGMEMEFVNNADWTCSTSITSFLREVGKYITVSYMIAKETVKTRLEGDGISYTEFSYMLIQANDFLHLFQNKNCKMQVGGSDQWGNLTCGLELIRKKLQKEAHAFTIPLLTDSNGKKFGKSEGGALWLDPNLTSPFKLHQYLLNTPDQDVLKLISQLTFATSEQQAKLEQELKDSPEKRTAQNFLADELCNLIHGEQATKEAREAAAVLFGASPAGLPAEQLLEIFQEVPSYEIGKSDLLGQKYLDLLVDSGSCKSKGEAKRLIQNGGAYLNNDRVSEIDQEIKEQDLIDQKIIILRTGKKSYSLVKVS